MHDTPQLSPVWRRYAEAALAVGARLTQKALGPGRSPARVDDLVRRLHQDFDRLAEAAFASLPGPGLACSAGCDHCCRTLRVSASPLEVFALAHRLIDAAATDETLATAVGRLRLTRDPRPLRRVAGPHRPDDPCPLLGEGLCLVYTSRPLACRGCVSGDAELCAACDDERPVPRSLVHQLGSGALMEGVTQSLGALGLAGPPVELCSALSLVLNEEDAEKRWLRGEDVFAALRAAGAAQEAAG